MSVSQNQDDFQRLLEEKYPDLVRKPSEEKLLGPVFPTKSLAHTSAVSVRVIVPHASTLYDISMQPENIPEKGEGIVYSQGDVTFSGVVTLKGILVNPDDMNRETLFLIISHNDSLEILKAISAPNFLHKFANSPNRDSETNVCLDDISASDSKTDPD